MTDDMACDELVATITDYIEGTLAPGDRARFEAHLPACPFCTTYLDQMRATIARLGTVEAGTLSAERRDRVIAAFRSRSARS